MICNLSDENLAKICCVMNVPDIPGLARQLQLLDE